MIDVSDKLSLIKAADPYRNVGRIRSFFGLSLRATLLNARLGEIYSVNRPNLPPLLAEVGGFVEEQAVLLPLGDMTGLGTGDPVYRVGSELTFPCSPALLGRIINGLGQPIDGGPPINAPAIPVLRAAPDALSRPRIDRILPIGIRALDSFVPTGFGQRVGVFSGSGVGKSSLLGQIAREAQADVIVVCLIGERGREIREFIEDKLGDRGLRRSVVITATSDAPSLIRLTSAYVATAVAEYFRDSGQNVVLLMDSITRFARSAREVGLSLGEAPTRRGYPPSVFSRLPSLLERTGFSDKGSITAFYTVLVEGDDLDEPIADEIRGLLDGHIVLSRSLASRGHWPAIDVIQSLSRLKDRICTTEHSRSEGFLRSLLSHYQSKQDAIELGAYKPGSDSDLDLALRLLPQINAFLIQRSDEVCSLSKTIDALANLAQNPVRTR